MCFNFASHASLVAHISLRSWQRVGRMEENKGKRAISASLLSPTKLSELWDLPMEQNSVAQPKGQGDRTVDLSGTH